MRLARFQENIGCMLEVSQDLAQMLELQGRTAEAGELLTATLKHFVMLEAQPELAPALDLQRRLSGVKGEG